MGALPRDWLVACLLLYVREGGASRRELTEEMRDMGFGSVRPGEMYRTLRELKREGLIVHEGQDAEHMLSRRRYKITSLGDLLTGAVNTEADHRTIAPEGRAFLKAASYTPSHEEPGR